MPADWSHLYAQRMRNVKSSAIRELLKLTERPEVISFAGGLPAPELFPTERFRYACHKVLQENSTAALQYGPTEGYRPLRELIASRMAGYGLRVGVENVLITSGSQQALDLIPKLLINRGDRILVEAPTYLGALQSFNLSGAEYITVPIDANGLQIDLLERALESGPKFMYILPNFQNPSGTTLSRERREQLVRISEERGIPIVEDDPYGNLRYSGEHIPPLLVLDSVNLGSEDGLVRGNVIHLGTFSKVLAPGLRIGWIVAPKEVISRFVQLKQSADLHTSTFAQMVTYEVARDGFLDEHVETIRRVYRERRDIMLAALDEFFPSEVTWTRPEGGLFLWVTLPQGVDCLRLFQTAIKCNVAFVPGDSFYPGNRDCSHLRLNFSNALPEQIYEGIKRLSLAVKEEMRNCEVQV